MMHVFRMGTFAALTLFSILAAVGFHVYIKLDINKRVYNHQPGKCELVSGPEYGSEDVELVPTHGVAFISSGLYYMHERPKNVVGKIFVYDLNQKSGFTATPVDIAVAEGGTFRLDQFGPHGISHVVVNGKPRLFVISHTPQFEHTVEIFDYDSQSRKLHHVRTVASKEFLVRPNDLYALSADRFVFTNDGSAQTSIGGRLEGFLSLLSGSVAIYENGKFRWLLSSLPSPNGITWDAERRFLYVASPYAETVTRYIVEGIIWRTASQLNIIDFSYLHPSVVVPMDSSVDNLYVDDRGDVWTGAHPLGWDIMRSLSNPDNHDIPASSQVLRIRFSADGQNASVDEIFANDGDISGFGGTSVAVAWSDQLLIGTVYRRLMHCFISDGIV